MQVEIIGEQWRSGRRELRCVPSCSLGPGLVFYEQVKNKREYPAANHFERAGNIYWDQMNQQPCAIRIALAIICLAWRAFVAAQPQPTFVTPSELKGQYLIGPIAATRGTGGFDGRSTDTGFRIEFTVPGGPAEQAGLRVGDVIVSWDGRPANGLDIEEFFQAIRSRKPAEILRVGFKRNGEEILADLVVQGRSRVYPDEQKTPNAVSQEIFQRAARITAAVAEFPTYPNHAFLLRQISSIDAPPFPVDDGKFFVLDGSGRQLKRVTLDEIKYSIGLQVAQNWRGRGYTPPAPPPPQRQYTITGTETGNYNVTSVGGASGNVSGTSTNTYTVTQQPDYNQLGYSLGVAIRQALDKKSNDKLLQQGQQAVASWEALYFKATAPIVPKENRFGQIMYWAGANQTPKPPFQVVLLLTDSHTQREKAFTFLFGDGAERLKASLVSRTAPTNPVSQLRLESQGASLRNQDVLEMLKAGLSEEIVIAKIRSSACVFDTAPATLKELKAASVPDGVILTMIQTRNGPKQDD